jgi:hypothetical protein
VHVNTGLDVAVKIHKQVKPKRFILNEVKVYQHLQGIGTSLFQYLSLAVTAITCSWDP